MAPLIKELEKDKSFNSLVCVTGQHREMLDSVLEVFGIVPNWDLAIMRANQTLPYITAAVVEKLSAVLEECTPDLILVHGDTTTSFAAGLAGFYKQIPVGHVEAGLRSFNKYSPFPEEMNRVLTGRLADLHFTPTQRNWQNLIDEGITEGLYVTGNTVIDAMDYTVSNSYRFQEQILNNICFAQCRTILLTAHRRENLGVPLESICGAVRDIVAAFPDVHVVFPVHKNPAVRDTVYRMLGGIPSVHLTDPLSVLDMHNVIHRCYLVLTDSGGLQEEAPALHKPVLVLRTETERPEVIENGGALLVGVQRGNIVQMTSQLLQDAALYRSMMTAKNPYGDGKAAARIAAHIKDWIEARG